MTPDELKKVESENGEAPAGNESRQRKLAWAEMTVQRLRIEEGDFVFITGGEKRVDAGAYIEDELKRRGLDDVSVVMAPRHYAITMLPEDQMNRIGWYRRVATDDPTDDQTENTK